MATQTVYYNFPKIDLNLNGIETPVTTHKIQYNTVGQPNVNIQYNNANYSATAFYFTKSSDANYLIAECHQDINDSTSNHIYFAVPLTLSKTESTNKNNTDIDNVIDSNGNNTVSLTLNNTISALNNNSCSIFTANNVVTIITKTPFTIASTTLPAYESSNIQNLTLSGASSDATLQSQDLDWVMTCELLTEDGPETTQLVGQEATAMTITFFMMSIIIVCFVYLFAPVFYTEVFIKYKVLDKLNNNHYAMNFYWGVFLFFIGLICFINGIVANSRIYYFIAIAIILSYFSGTSAILKLPGISNSNGTSFAKTDDMFMVFTKFIIESCKSNELFSLWSRFAWYGFFVVFVIGSIICMTVGISKKLFAVFLSGIILYSVTPIYILAFIANN